MFSLDSCYISLVSTGVVQYRSGQYGSVCVTKCPNGTEVQLSKWAKNSTRNKRKKMQMVSFLKRSRSCSWDKPPYSKKGKKAFVSGVSCESKTLSFSIYIVLNTSKVYQQIVSPENVWHKKTETISIFLMFNAALCIYTFNLYSLMKAAFTWFKTIAMHLLYVLWVWFKYQWYFIYYRRNLCDTFSTWCHWLCSRSKLQCCRLIHRACVCCRVL